MFHISCTHDINTLQYILFYLFHDGNSWNIWIQKPAVGVSVSPYPAKKTCLNQPKLKSSRNISKTSQQTCNNKSMHFTTRISGMWIHAKYLKWTEMINVIFFYFIIVLHLSPGDKHLTF